MKTTSWHTDINYSYTLNYSLQISSTEALVMLLKAASAVLDCTLSKFSQNMLWVSSHCLISDFVLLEMFHSPEDIAVTLIQHQNVTTSQINGVIFCFICALPPQLSSVIFSWKYFVYMIFGSSQEYFLSTVAITHHPYYPLV